MRGRPERLFTLTAGRIVRVMDTSTGPTGPTPDHRISDSTAFTPARSCLEGWTTDGRRNHLCERNEGHDGSHRCGCGVLARQGTERDPLDDELLRELAPTMLDDPERVELGTTLAPPQDPGPISESELRRLWGDR